MAQIALAFVGLAGCAPRPAQTATQVVVDVRTESVSPRADRAPQRLDHVITLGHDTYLPGLPGAPPVAGAAPAIVIQNQITVQQQPAWGGYGYGYSYGGYGYSTPAYPTFRTPPANPVTGTPPVAGDWPAPPSYGPRPMR